MSKVDHGIRPITLLTHVKNPDVLRRDGNADKGAGLTVAQKCRSLY
jgi:hypothetical protein